MDDVWHGIRVRQMVQRRDLLGPERHRRAVAAAAILFQKSFRILLGATVERVDVFLVVLREARDHRVQLMGGRSRVRRDVGATDADAVWLFSGLLFGAFMTHFIDARPAAAVHAVADAEEVKKIRNFQPPVSEE